MVDNENTANVVREMGACKLVYKLTCQIQGVGEALNKEGDRWEEQVLSSIYYSGSKG